ncbi:MAG: AEC family transporter [Candidatus Wallbacteria bacterium]|nr:AEC family transporter [Candidatus Wallbacteria bacterium]
MSALIAVLKIIFPIYSIIALGYYFNRTGKYNQKVDAFLNQVAFYYIMPVVLFKGLLFNDVKFTSGILQIPGFMLLAFILMFAVFYLFKIPLQYLIMSFRGNTVYFGIPILKLTLNEQDFLTGILVISLISPLTIFLVTILKPETGGLRKILLNTLKNPFLWVLILGIILGNSGFNFDFLQSLLSEISDALTFISLIIIGGNLSFKELKKVSALENMAIFNKLMLFPLLFLFYGKMVGLDPACMKIGLLLASTPGAVTNYTIIRELGLPEREAVRNVMLSSFIYFIYLPVLLLFLDRLCR